MSARTAEALGARKAAIRASMAASLDRRRAALAGKRAALEARRAVRGGRSKKKDRRWLLLLLLFLLFLLPPCTPPPEPIAVAPAAPPVVVPTLPAAPPVPTPSRITRTNRPAFASVVPPKLPWLDAFRLQVAARSPRLAACFDGASRPGALKWSAAVEPVRGRVSDQTLESTLSSDALTTTQRGCVLAVLSDPPYRLDGSGAASTPSRVGMVVEF